MELERFLENRSGDIPHACLITGPGDLRGPAAALAAEMMGPEGRRKVLAGIHPDVSVLDGGGGMIKVDPVRALRADVFVRPNEGARKIFIILGADLMNPNAANALLKVLEEPPAYAAFILTAQNPAALPETVLSRCVRLTCSAAAQSAPEHEKSLAALTDALKGKNELALFKLFASLEPSGREGIRAFCAAGAGLMAAAAGGARTAGDKNAAALAGAFGLDRLAGMGRLLSRYAADISNMNPGILSGCVCASLWDEAFNNPPTERKSAI